MAMRILISKPLCTDHSILYFQRAFQKLGHESPIVESWSQGSDFVFLQTFCRYNIGQTDVIAFWLTDIEGSIQGTFSLQHELVRRSKIVFIAHKNYFTKALDKPYVFLPFGVDESFKEATKLEEPVYDVGMVGSGRDVRARDLALLKHEGLSVHVWGEVWKTHIQYLPFLEGRTGLQGLIDAHKHLRMVYNQCEGYMGGLNMRVYEALGMGKLLLTNRVKNIMDEEEPDIFFKDGKHLVIYENPQDLVNKCKYYRDHPEEREAIAKAGQEEVYKYHTYDIRAETVINEMRGRA